MAGVFSKLFSYLSPNRPKKSATESRLDRILDAERDRLTPRREPRPDDSAQAKLQQRLDKIRQERERLDEKRKSRESEPSDDPEERFLNDAQWQNVDGSSNVQAYRYLLKDMALEVQFLDGSIYQYTGVPPWKAVDFYRAGGRGTAVWDYLRIRGTKLGHQHPYYMLIGPIKGAGKQIHPGFGTRKWERSAKAARAHAKRAERQSKGPTGYARKDAAWEARKAKIKGEAKKKK